MESKKYAGEPESLHAIGASTDKKSVDSFVNPGTPENAMVSMADRKTGVVSGTASEQLKNHLGAAANADSSMSSKTNGQTGMLPKGN